MVEFTKSFYAEPFNISFLQQIVNFVKPMWSFSEWQNSFREIYVETILRNNFFQNELAFQLSRGEKLLSAMFFQRKEDKNQVDQWVKEKSINLPIEYKSKLKLCLEYLSYMDSKVHHIMTTEDIKLSLFVGLEKGYGTILFEDLWLKIKTLGYKNMYLWTDCECNWEWYTKKKFELIEESDYPIFNTKTNTYKTYVFKKSITG